MIRIEDLLHPNGSVSPRDFYSDMLNLSQIYLRTNGEEDTLDNIYFSPVVKYIKDNSSQLFISDVRLLDLPVYSSEDFRHIIKMVGLERYSLTKLLSLFLYHFHHCEYCMQNITDFGKEKVMGATADILFAEEVRKIKEKMPKKSVIQNTSSDLNIENSDDVVTLDLSDFTVPIVGNSELIIQKKKIIISILKSGIRFILLLIYHDLSNTPGNIAEYRQKDLLLFPK